MSPLPARTFAQGRRNPRAAIAAPTPTRRRGTSGAIPNAWSVSASDTRCAAASPSAAEPWLRAGGAGCPFRAPAGASSGGRTADGARYAPAGVRIAGNEDGPRSPAGGHARADRGMPTEPPATRSGARTGSGAAVAAGTASAATASAATASVTTASATTASATTALAVSIRSRALGGVAFARRGRLVAPFETGTLGSTPFVADARPAGGPPAAVVGQLRGIVPTAARSAPHSAHAHRP